MKQIIFIIFYVLLAINVKAQIAFNTVVPVKPIVTGSSFQVQYIIEGAETIDDFKHPLFENFRKVTEANIYSGNSFLATGQKKVRNIVFTLEAIRPGKFIILGASAVLDEKLYKSQSVVVHVISEKEAMRIAKKEKENNFSNYFLRPGEDPYKKIKDNLFMKVQVDKRTCYTGEPVLAIFKLYSSLQSKSDIVKNPGFYGFSVFDMINLTDKEVALEKINGQLYDVHTIRKVQLYPLRSGIFTIDPMVVMNKVEFSRTAINKKAEQQIAEGLYGLGDQSEKKDAIYYESAINTEAITINVKPLPANNKPDDFNGATGTFSVSASLLKNELAKNEEGMLEVTVKGTGNFIQLIAPIVNWPEGVDSFEPTIEDNFDKSMSPLNGSRIFRYPFVCTSKGENNIPAVQFSYFDIDSNRFASIATSPISFRVSEEQKISHVAAKKKTSITDINKNTSRIAAVLIIGLILIVLIYWMSRKKEIVSEADISPIMRPNTEQIIKAATDSINNPGIEFYQNLYQSVWTYLTINFHLEGSRINKTELLKSTEQKNIPVALSNKLEWILAACETGQYANATPSENKESLLQAAKEVINSLEEYLL